MKKLLLIISGGIAAYKALELIRLLKKADKEVKCVATESAMTFITSASDDACRLLANCIAMQGF